MQIRRQAQPLSNVPVFADLVHQRLALSGYELNIYNARLHLSKKHSVVYQQRQLEARRGCTSDRQRLMTFWKKRKKKNEEHILNINLMFL